MSRQVVLRPEAEADALAARTWYEERQAGLGDRFAQAIVALVERLAANPLAYPVVYGQIRRAILPSFPYAIYFRVHGDVVVVLAVHGRQHPSRWRQRG